MINTNPGLRLLFVAALLGATALVSACGSPSTTQTTTTQRTTTVAPQPATSVTTTRTQQTVP
jgi:hypothetical protein